MQEKIIAAFKQMLIQGNEEINAYTLSVKVGISEKEFYQHFNTVEDVARKIWTNLGETVIETLNSSELFRSYPPRQKILSYFFTFFEEALNERTFISKTANNETYLTAYKAQFKRFAADVVQEGVATEDMKERLSLSNYYPEVLWNLHTRLLNFWLNDSSPKFEETEKAIEIYSKLPLELMGHNLIDSLFETIKFQLDKSNLLKFNLNLFN